MKKKIALFALFIISTGFLLPKVAFCELQYVYVDGKRLSAIGKSSAPAYLVLGKRVTIILRGPNLDLGKDPVVVPSQAGTISNIVKRNDQTYGPHVAFYFTPTTQTNANYSIDVHYLVEFNGYESCVFNSVNKGGTVTSAYFYGTPLPVRNSSGGLYLKPGTIYNLELNGTGLSNMQVRNKLGPATTDISWVKSPNWCTFPYNNGERLLYNITYQDNLKIKGTVVINPLGTCEKDAPTPSTVRVAGCLPFTDNRIQLANDPACISSLLYDKTQFFVKNAISNVSVSGKIGTSLYDWYTGTGNLILPDLVPGDGGNSFSAAITPPIVLYRPLTTQTAFIDSRNRAYLPLDAFFCNRDINGFLNNISPSNYSETINGESVVISDYTKQIGDGNYQVSNVASSMTAPLAFNMKIQRFLKPTDATSSSNPILVKDFTISSGNFPQSGSSRTTNFARPIAHVYIISSKPGCYIRRDGGANIPGSSEEGNYKITIDGGNTIRESCETNNLFILSQ